MKNLLVILSLIFVFASCNNTEEKKDKECKDDEKKEVVEEKNDVNSEKDNKNNVDMSSCDEFLTDYEAWVNQSIEILKEAKANPTDVKSSEKMMQVTMEMSEWAEKWAGLINCSEDEDFNKKIKELEDKINTELGE